jgi:Zn finger protein HypA/HybF involved in hydrogenase expression
MKLPPNLTIETVMAGVERAMSDCENVGFCLSCGQEADGCEPDAEKYTCEACGSNMVYGAEQILICCAL